MLDSARALSVLDWWIGAGVDTSIEEVPRNWLAEPRTVAAASPPAALATPAPATLPVTLAGFHAWLAESETLPDGSRQGRRILPSGDATGGIMIMIDMPEPADQAAAMLLSEESGRLFDRMLAAIGRDRSSVYLTALCLERPMGGRVDDAAMRRLGEIARHHIALAAPKRVLLMGQAVNRAVLGMELVHARQKLHILNHAGATVTATNVQAVATFAPRFLIQSPARKADAWKDLRLLIGGIES